MARYISGPPLQLDTLHWLVNLLLFGCLQYCSVYCTHFLITFLFSLLIAPSYSYPVINLLILSPHSPTTRATDKRRRTTKLSLLVVTSPVVVRARVSSGQRRDGVSE